MKKKKILLQCQGIVYYYMGLAAIYTKYPDRNVDIDVLFSSSKYMDFEPFVEKLKKSKYINNTFSVLYKMPPLFKSLANEQKTFKNYFKYYTRHIKSIKKYVREKTNLTKKYSEIFFSHELGNLLITSLKFLYPKANFVAYGDGSGLLFSKNTKLIDVNNASVDYKFFKEVIPDEVIGLLPQLMDNSLNLAKVPVRGTNPKVFSSIIKDDEKIQADINLFSDEIINKYKGKEINVLLMALLNRDMFLMSEENQLNIYLDIINKYCSDDSVLIFKPHPTDDGKIKKYIEEKCTKQITFIEIPSNLNTYPIEVYFNLLQNANRVITFFSSSKLSLTYAYNINCIDAYDIIQNYSMKHYANIVLDFYNNILNRVSTWDKKSIIYEEDVTPSLIKINEDYLS